MATISIPTATFTRPANVTPYASGQLVANSTTAGSVIPMTFTIRPENRGSVLRRARIRKTSVTVSGASFRLHLYNSSTITNANGDGGVWSTTLSSYIGSFDITVDKAFTDGAQGVGIPTVGTDMDHNNGVIYGLLEARGTYTPTSGEVFTVELVTVLNPSD